MVWFRVDDVLPFHERVIRAGNAAMGLWVRAGAWSSGQLTDGFIPADVARTLGTPAEIRRLVDVGLWMPADQGFQFHAWAEDGTGTKRQPTRAEVEATRRAERERKAAWRESRRDGGRTPPPVPQGVPPGHPPDGHWDSGRKDGGRPDTPARPDPTRPKEQDQERSSEPSSDPRPTGTELAVIPPKPPARNGSEYPAAFEAFWHAYPRREGKRKAFAAWQAACRRARAGATVERGGLVPDGAAIVLDGARRYAADPNRDPAYTAHPTTWLNRDGWHDAPLPARRPESAQDRLAASAARMMHELGAPMPGRRGA